LNQLSKTIERIVDRMHSESEMFGATLLINIVTVIQKGRADEASAESERSGGG
jgi:hypothetical protein